MESTTDANITSSETESIDFEISNSSFPNVTNDETEETTIPSTTSGVTDASFSYSAAPEETSTLKEEEPTTVKPSPAHGYAALLQPSILALVVPVCLRLSTINLLGVV